jgi:ABC-type sulfate/molybdate transport systems ATPase subunit
MGFLEISNISRYQDGKPIVDDISFSQKAFQKIAIAGETGSGKSTLLKMIAGLVQPDKGMIYFNDKHVLGPEFKLIPGHSDIAYLSQHFELRNAYRVEELLSYANKLTDEMANAIFEVCMINHLAKRKTDQLSGGERQRIAIAQLLIRSPKLLILDEPYSNLDLIHKNILKNVIREIGDSLQITCLMVSHDPSDLLPWADEIILMKAGIIVQQGKPEYVYRHPSSAYAAGLLGDYYILPSKLSDAFRKFAGFIENGKEIFVRPEYFKIVSEQDGIEATVRERNFLAGVYSLELSIADTNITIKTMQKHPQKGDKIFIVLEKEAFEK